MLSIEIKGGFMCCGSAKYRNSFEMGYALVLRCIRAKGIHDSASWQCKMAGVP